MTLRIPKQVRCQFTGRFDGHSLIPERHFRSVIRIEYGRETRNQRPGCRWRYKLGHRDLAATRSEFHLQQRLALLERQVLQGLQEWLRLEFALRIEVAPP